MIPEIVNTKGFFYGTPSIYALVDALSYRIYLVNSEPKHLSLIKSVFVSKRNLAIVKIPEKYHTDDVIDNSVAVGWKIVKVPGYDFFPGKMHFCPTEILQFPSEVSLQKSQKMYAQRYDLSEENMAHFHLEEAVYIESDLDFVKQCLMFSGIIQQLNETWAELSSADKNAIKQAFSRSLTVDDLNVNLAKLAAQYYREDNMAIGHSLYAVVPRSLRYI